MSYRDKQFNTMRVEVTEHVAVVRFHRPEARNAANVEMSFERLEIYRGVAEDPEVRAVIVTGDEKAYCAGGDLAAFSRFDEAAALEFSRRGVEYQKLLMDMPKPTIAAVSGPAYGGGMENVLLCDLRIASETAQFALSEINVGIFPGGGGTQRLVQNLPVCRAKELIFFGGPIDAREALELGLVNKVVPQDQLMDEAMEWARKLCRKPPIALEKAKQAVNAAWGRDIYSGMDLESKLWSEVYATEDQKEGMHAFLEKRRPLFKGQ